MRMVGGRRQMAAIVERRAMAPAPGWAMWVYKSVATWMSQGSSRPIMPMANSEHAVD